MVTRITLIACYGPSQPPNWAPLAVEVLAGFLKQRFGKEVLIEIQTLDERQDMNGIKLAKELVACPEIDIIGLSVPQSTLSVVVSFLHHLSSLNSRHLIVLGHALPTHAAETFLRRFPHVLVVRGWGEAAIAGIVAEFRTGEPNWNKVPSLAFQKEGKIITTPIDCTIDPTSPTRVRVRNFFARIESSRGCHYDSCTFCARQPKGPNTPRWFRFPVGHVLSEIEKIKVQGATHFNFADEDFFGNDLDGAEKIALGLKNIGGMKISLSLRVDNIYNPDEPTSLALRRLDLLRLLKEAGLSLIFAGVESFSDTQLRRFAKGLRAADCVRAVKSVLDLGIPLELGYILFDPLLTVSEFRENVIMLEKTSFWKFTGQMFTNLRVRADSGFAEMLETRGLLGRFNPDTIEYDYSYQDPRIALIAAACLQWKNEVDEVHLLARNVQRTTFDGGPSGLFIKEYRSLQIDILRGFVAALERADAMKLDPFFVTRRCDLAAELRRNLLSKKSLTPPEQVVFTATERFLESTPPTSSYHKGEFLRAALSTH